MQIKRTLTYFEEIALEAGQPIDPPLRCCRGHHRQSVAGRFERDLSRLTDASAEIGQRICQIAISLLSPHEAESYGKAALIGMSRRSSS
jgi:hypothetical protein